MRLPRRVVGWANAAPPHMIDVGAACLLGLLLLTQLPRAHSLYFGSQQTADLERVDEMESRCQKYHVDAATAQTLALELLRLRDEGRTLLVATHDPRMLELPGIDRMLELDRGRLSAVRPSDQAGG